MYANTTLQTDLEHISSKDELEKIISANENVVVVCGRMGPMCVPVYGVMEELRDSGNYDNIKFYDFLFDNPEATVIKSLPEAQTFRGLPFTIYYKNGKVAHATSSIQNAKQVKTIIDENLK